MGFINIKNKLGTTGKEPPSGYTSWLDYWERKKGKKAMYCEAQFCLEKCDIGGHVVRVGEEGKGYVLPLCKGHDNMTSDEVYQVWDTDLVPVPFGPGA